MADLRITREFPTTPERLFEALTQQAQLLQWWGPEAMHVPEHDLDFTRLGPWFSVMANDEGQRFKVSGQVTSIDPPRSVGFTWAWHDEEDRRGAESHVMFTVEAAGDGAKLILDHRQLADDEASANHDKGWSSSFRKLGSLFQ